MSTVGHTEMDGWKSQIGEVTSHSREVPELGVVSRRALRDRRPGGTFMSLDAGLPDKNAEIQSVVRRYRGYMRMLAEYRLDPRLRGKLDPSDIVQQSMVHACQGWHEFRGTSEGERLAWLKAIVVRNLLHALRDFRRAKRDVCREFSLDNLIDASSSRLQQWLVAEETTPSVRLERAEQLLRIADAVEGLPDGQRETVTLFYWHGCTLAEISSILGRSSPAVAGLLHRGLKRLRMQLCEPA